MITIAIAEDCKDHFEKFSSLIESNKNFKIVNHSYSGLQMVQWLTQTKQLPQVLIVDYQMNPMDGQQLIQYVILEKMNVKILAFSNHNHHYAVKSMFECGATGYLNKVYLFCNDKDYAKATIAEAIETVASGKLYLDPFISDNVFSMQQNNVFAMQNGYYHNLNARINYLKITPCEYRAMYLFCCGFRISEIIDITYTTTKTIDSHLCNIKKKLLVTNDRDLCVEVIRQNIIPSAKYERA